MSDSPARAAIGPSSPSFDYSEKENLPPSPSTSAFVSIPKHLSSVSTIHTRSRVPRKIASSAMNLAEKDEFHIKKEHANYNSASQSQSPALRGSPHRYSIEQSQSSNNSQSRRGRNLNHIHLDTNVMQQQHNYANSQHEYGHEQASQTDTEQIETRNGGSESINDVGIGEGIHNISVEPSLPRLFRRSGNSADVAAEDENEMASDEEKTMELKYNEFEDEKEKENDMSKQRRRSATQLKLNGASEDIDRHSEQMENDLDSSHQSNENALAMDNDEAEEVIDMGDDDDEQIGLQDFSVASSANANRSSNNDSFVSKLDQLLSRAHIPSDTGAGITALSQNSFSQSSPASTPASSASAAPSTLSLSSSSSSSSSLSSSTSAPPTRLAQRLEEFADAALRLTRRRQKDNDGTKDALPSRLKQRIFQTLARLVSQHPEEVTAVGSSTLAVLIQLMNTFSLDISTVSDELAKMEFFKLLADYYEQVQRRELTVVRLSLDDLIKAAKEKYLQQSGAQQLFDWYKLGSDCECLTRSVHMAPFLKATLAADTQPKPKVIRKQRRQRRMDDADEADEIQEAKMVNGADGVNDDEESMSVTSQRVLQLHQQLPPARAKVPYFQFVLHPRSFSKTIENIFHVSFLIKQRKAVMEMLDTRKQRPQQVSANTFNSSSSTSPAQQLIPWLWLANSEDAHEEQMREQTLGERKSHVVSLNYAMWKKLVQLYNIAKPYIKDEEDEDEQTEMQQQHTLQVRSGTSPAKKQKKSRTNDSSEYENE